MIAKLRHRLLAAAFVLSIFASPKATLLGDDAGSPTWDSDIAIGGCGGAYFLADPGELTVDVFKRDRNRRGRTTELRAILFGPDRRVLEEIRLPDDGQRRGGLGPVQKGRLSTVVQYKGVYGVNITVSQDRYGDEIIWGLRTNCRRYLIETSRGHRDQRREEPIVLLGPDEPENVCFLPRRGLFRIEVSQLAQRNKAVRLFDAQQILVRTMEVDDQGNASCEVPADPARGDRPWRLEVPSQPAQIQIDGVTRWTSGEVNENLPLWSPDPTTFFPFHQYRWLLTPYQRQVHGVAGAQRAVEFQVHNNSRAKATIDLKIETDSSEPTFRLSRTRLEVPSRTSAPVTVTCTVPGDGQDATCRVRATPLEHPDFTTYSTLSASSTPPRAAQPIDIPLILKPYQHENELFGYLPEYPVENQVYFDLENRAYVQANGGFAFSKDGQWQRRVVRSAVTTPSWQGRPLGIISTKIAFDCDNDMYLLGRSGRDYVYLHSADGGKSFSVTPIPGRAGESCAFDIEQFSGHNVPSGPPPVVRFTRTGSDPRLIWRRINDLDLFLPTKQSGQIALGEPIRLSSKCLGLSAHSGIPSSVVSRGDRVHVAWGEATDPDRKVPGVPTYVVTVDRTTRTSGKPALVGYGPPANDVHNSPSITIDSRGTLHVLVGTHGQPFPYSRSLEPNDAGRGWTDPLPVGDGRETYIGLVCDDDDTLHLICRMWRTNVEPHPLSIHATLAHQRKPAGQPWEAPRVLIVSPFSEYSIFYHRLTIDRIGRLFVSYDYWSTYWFYRTDHRGDRRALLMSPDHGESWKLVESRDLESRGHF